MELRCPQSGFSEFLTYREAYSEEVEVIIEDDCYVFRDLDALKLWMRQVGVHHPFIERFVDLIWNWRLLKFNLKSQHLSVPDVQTHPLRDTSPEHRPFRVPRSLDFAGGRDIFDPLQDKRDGSWNQ